MHVKNTSTHESRKPKTHRPRSRSRSVGTCLCDWSASPEVAEVRGECYAVLWSLLSHLTRNRGTFHLRGLQHKMVYAFMMSSFSVSQHIWKTLALQSCCSPVSTHAWHSSSVYSNRLPVCLRIIHRDSFQGRLKGFHFGLLELCLMLCLGSGHMTTSQRRNRGGIWFWW